MSFAYTVVRVHHSIIAYPITVEIYISTSLRAAPPRILITHPQFLPSLSLSPSRCKMHFSLLTLGMLPLAIQAAPQSSEPPSPGPGVPNMGFELYAYGEEFGGLSVFNWNGNRTSICISFSVFLISF